MPGSYFYHVCKEYYRMRIVGLKLPSIVHVSTDVTTGFYKASLTVIIKKDHNKVTDLACTSGIQQDCLSILHELVESATSNLNYRHEQQL